MDRVLEIDTLPTPQARSSQPLAPGSPAAGFLTEEMGDDEARIQSSRTTSGIVVHRLPAEIWMVICDALRRLDLIHYTNRRDTARGVLPELQRTSTNKNRADPIITAVSILQLSQTCRYLHKVTSPSLLETIRLRPPSHGHGESPYLSVIQQVRSLQRNSNQRLQHVRAFAVTFARFLNGPDRDHRSDLRNQICHLLTRLPGLRHLAVSGIALNGPLMRKILTLPLEHLWLWDVEPDNPIPDHTFIFTTTPKIKLRSLVLWEESWRDEPSIPINWISQLIGTTMQDLSFDASELVPPVLPVLPGLEFLEFPATVYRNLISPGMLCGVLSKTPNLKEAVFAVKAAQGDPVNTIPALSHLERIVCHASWLRFLIPRRPITTAEVLCDSQVRVQGLFEILHQGSVPLRDITLTYANEWPDPTWSPDDLEPVARYLPELEILRLRIQDPKVAGLQQALFYISQLQKLRIVSFSFRKESSRYDGGLLDDVWQELKLRELIGLTRSPFLERVSFGEECEWRLENPRVWILWQGGKMVRFVSL